MSPAVEYWDAATGLPDRLQSLVGKQVENVWWVERNKLLIIFASGESMEVRGIAAFPGKAITFEFGEMVPGADVSFLKEFKVRDLQGTQLEGLEGAVLTFRSKSGQLYGAEMNPDVVRWLKEDNPN